LSNAFDSLTDDKGRFAGVFKERWVLDFEFIDEAEVPKVCVDYENERRHHANMVELGFARGKFSLSKYEHEEILETA
jgi:transposase